MGQSSSTPGRRSGAAGRGPSAPAQQQQRQVAGRYPGAPTADFNLNNAGPAIPNISQMQNIFIEGMRPELAHLNNPQRQSPPQAQLQRTFTIRNDVNLKKNSLKMVTDEDNPERYHLEFVFDAATECSVTVHYAATEITGEVRPRFVPLKEGASHPKEYRAKGMGQTFRTRPHSRVTVAHPSLAVPKLGCCTSSGRSRRLWAARHSHGEKRGHWAPSLCLGSSSSPPPEAVHVQRLYRGAHLAHISLTSRSPLTTQARARVGHVVVLRG